MFANTIADVSHINVKSIFDSVRGLSQTLTAQATALNMTFPYVTFENLEVFAGPARHASGLEVFAIVPYVNAAQFTEWNAYTTQHYQDWLQASYRYQRQMSNDDDDNLSSALEYQSSPLAPFVYDLSVNPESGETVVTPVRSDDEMGLFSPVWQTSPPNTQLLKANTFTIVPTKYHPQLAAQQLQGE